ncbi:TonB-dependent receptor [Novosphingobium soli]|uniref:TonB-dependent receptor n=1 Tax=Novosphingobium soli TaxID=574956 RepID=A0ABV6CZ33_9SPHN
MATQAWLLACVSGALAFTGTPAAAQDEAPAPSGPRAADGSPSAREDVTGADIIVTARRRAETAQETPVPMTVLSDALLDRYGVTGIDSIAQFTPGLFTGEASGAMGGSISLRGIGSGESMAFVDQAVSTNVDGVPISSAQILRAAQMDLQQIEILRGPQSLFFGKNSPGGIISILTADPGDAPELMVRAGYEFKAREKYVDVTGSAPLTDTLGLRLAAHGSRMEGYIRLVTPDAPGTSTPPPGVIPTDLHRFPKQDEMFLRATLAWQPSDRIKVRLKGTYTETEVVGGPSFYSDIVACPYGVGQRPFEDASNCENDGVVYTAALPPSYLALSPSFAGPYGGRLNRQYLLTGQVDWDLSEALTLTSVSGYYGVREDISSNGGYGPTSNNAFVVGFSNDQYSQELRLASDFDGMFDVVIGGFYEDRRLYTSTFIAVPGINLPLPTESTHQKQTSASAFGQLLFNPTEQIQVTAGGRYTHEVKDLRDFTVTPYGGTPFDVTTSPRYPGTRLKFDDFSPEVTVKFTPADDVMLFASYKQGFKSGGFDAGFTNGAIALDPSRDQSFDPEEVEGFEAGLKSRFADRQVTFNLTAYWYDYSGLQVSVFDTTSRAFRLQNAAKARIKGIEAETSFSPSAAPGLSLHAAVAYNDSKFRDYLADCYAGQTAALGCNQQFDTVLGRYTAQDLSGRRLRKAPVFTANLGGYFEAGLGALTTSVSADANYSGKYNAGTQLQPLAQQDAFWKLDASWRLFTADRKWELAVIGRNLTNERNLISGIDRTGTGGAKGTSGASCTAVGTPAGCVALADIIGTVAQPRSVAVQLTYNY